MSEIAERRRDIMTRVAMRRDSFALAWANLDRSAQATELTVRRGLRVARAVSGALAVATLIRTVVRRVRGRPAPLRRTASLSLNWPQIASAAITALRQLR